MLDVNKTVLSTPIKILSVFILLFMFLVGFYAYLFSINPLASSSFASIIANGLSIKVLDSYNVEIFNLASKPQNSVKANELPKNVVNALLTINYILDGNRTECSPTNLARQIKNHCNYSYTNLIANHYILTSLLDANNFNNKNTEDLFFRLRKYLVVHWLTKNFSENSFFEFLLNYSYYDNSLIGINDAAKSYFGVLDLKNLTTMQSIILAQKIVVNNPYIYDTPNIQTLNTNNIIETMYNLGYISLNSMQQAKSNVLIPVNKLSSNIYQIFTKPIITQALPNTLRTNNIVVTTTIDTVLQNNISKAVNTTLLNNNIPSASVIVLNHGNIVSGLTTTLGNDKNSYFNYYPAVKIEPLLRPLLYLALMTKSTNLPNSLLNPQIQAIIEEQILAPENLNTQMFPDFATQVNNADNSGNLNNTALNKAAIQLSALENTLFNKLNDRDYENLVKNTHLSEKSLNYATKPVSLLENFSNIVSAYSIINQEGNYVSPLFIKQIYNTQFSNDLNEQTPFNKTNTFIARSNIFKTEMIGSNVTYHTLYDKNMVIAFYGDYTVGVWLGDLKNSPEDNFSTTRYTALKQIIAPLISGLATTIASHNAPESNTANSSNNNVSQ